MDIRKKSLNDITKEAVSILNHTIGPTDTLRFLSQFTTGYGNYTQERKELFGSMTLDDIAAEIKKAREVRSEK